MKKIAATVAVIVVLPLLTAGGCRQGKMCEPHAVREDLNQPGRYFVCNDDGTKEEKVQGPTPAPATIKAIHKR